MNKRIKYAVITIVLIAVEVLIAMFVHDNFVRPYIGDVLAVIAVYTFVRIFVPQGLRLLPLWVFIFALGVELVQLINPLEALGLDSNTFLKIFFGSVFDIKDIICYAAGCLIVFLFSKR